MASRAGLKLVKKTVRGKHGSVKRSYWVKSNPDAGRKPGFFRRNAGKIAAVAALAGGAYLAHKHGRAIAGAVGGMKLGAAMAAQHAKETGKTLTLGNRLSARMLGAIHGANNHGGTITHKDVADAAHRAHTRMREAAHGFHAQATEYRRGHGAALAEHLTNVGGLELASHLGRRAGNAAGTAIGGAVGHLPGAAVGGFIGGEAGSFLANRHTAPHIERAAHHLAGWMQR